MSRLSRDWNIKKHEQSSYTLDGKDWHIFLANFYLSSAWKSITLHQQIKLTIIILKWIWRISRQSNGSSQDSCWWRLQYKPLKRATDRFFAARRGDIGHLASAPEKRFSSVFTFFFKNTISCTLVLRNQMELVGISITWSSAIIFILFLFIAG